MTTALMGGWSAWGPITPEEKLVFTTALEGFVGVNYQPQLVSTQIVAGTNYRYKCAASLPGSSGNGWEAIVQIFQPLQGSAHITHITPI